MEQFRIVRVFDSNSRPSGEREYRVETTNKLTEKEALELMEKLGSSYKGKRLLPNWSNR